MQRKRAAVAREARLFHVIEGHDGVGLDYVRLRQRLLQDLGARLVGESTFPKGSGSTIFQRATWCQIKISLFCHLFREV